MRNVSWAFGLTLLIGIVVGCDGGRRDLATELTYDSAGVSVHQSAPPYAEWSLGPEPLARIGVVEGEPAYQLSGVAYAARLRDGRTVIVDGGSSEIRWYGQDGTFLVRGGGRGDGPSELRRVVSATLSAQDTLILYDATNQRISWWSPAGDLARTRRVELGAGLHYGLLPFDSSGLLVVEERQVSNFGGAEFNYSRDSILVLGIRQDAEAVDTLLRTAGREAVTWVDYSDGQVVASRQSALPLGQRSLVAAVSNRIVVVGPGRSDLEFFDRRGELTGLARRTDVPRLPVSDSERREFVDSQILEAEQRGLQASLARAWAQARIDLLPEGSRLPAFDRMLVDVAGDRIWTRDFEPEWTPPSVRRWTIYDSFGQVLGRLAMPANITVMHVAQDFIVGVERDERDVEYVATYALSFPG